MRIHRTPMSVVQQKPGVKNHFQPLVMEGGRRGVNKGKGTQHTILWRPPWLPFSFSPSQCI